MNGWIAGCMIVVSLPYVFVLVRAGAAYNAFIAEHRMVFPALSRFAPAMLYVLDKYKDSQAVSRALASLTIRMNVLYGVKKGFLYARYFLAQIGVMTYTSLLLVLAVSAAGEGDLTLLTGGLGAVILVPFVLFRHLDGIIKRRKRAMIVELPQFLNKVTLLVGAGETVQKAIIRSVEQSLKKQHPLYAELKQVVADLRNNCSFSQALDDFNKRCGTQEVSIFCTTVLINYRRGGEEFVLALKALSRELWEKRKAVTRTMGEEASAKLIFPMMLVFLGIMSVVAAPAIMQMNP